MVSSVRPIVTLISDEVPAPEPLVKPNHDPLRSAFVPYSSGLLMNEIPLYMEWRADRGDFSWNNKTWPEVEGLYSFWPFLTNAGGVQPKEGQFDYDPAMIYALVVTSPEDFIVLGTVVIHEPPSLDLTEVLETEYADTGATRWNIALVPLEIFAVPEETIASIVYYWNKTLKKFDWSRLPFHLDALVFWSNMTRELFNELLDQGINPFTGGTPLKSEPAYVSSVQSMMWLRFLGHRNPSYNDPTSSSAFMADLRRQMPSLPYSVTPAEISYFFSTGRYIDSLGQNPDVYRELNGILCKYPDDLQHLLLSGSSISLDPKDAEKIGAGFYVGRRINEQGAKYINYEYVLQPRPKSSRPSSQGD